MSDSLRTPEDYELLIYGLRELFPSIRESTVTLTRLGATLGRVTGELRFEHGFRIVVRERIVFDRLPVSIDSYGYEIWRGDEKLSWYDSQPHPNDPTLESSHPHHKHIPPNIKTNRIPAPQISFNRPNFRVIIEEVTQLVSEIRD